MSTITLARIERVDGSTRELTDSILPVNFLLNAVEVISALSPDFKILTKFSGTLISITIFLRSSNVIIKLSVPNTPCAISLLPSLPSISATTWSPLFNVAITSPTLTNLSSISSFSLMSFYFIL